MDRFASLLRRIARRSAVALSDASEKLERELLFLEANEQIREHRHLLERNSKLFNLHAGRRAFVIGNGPSLKKQDLTLLRGELTFCVNAFFKHPVVTEWEPTYYFVTDGQLFASTPVVDEFFSELQQRCPTSKLFLPVGYYNRILEIDIKAPEFVALNGFLHHHGDNFNFDMTKVIPSGSTVVQTALLMAVWMGCNPIYLLGCDHDWLDDFGSDHHFYPGATVSHVLPPEQNPFRNDYLTLTEYVVQMWRGYAHIKKFADKKDVKILNATLGGRLDVFDRSNYESLFSHKSDGVEDESSEAFV